MARCSRTTAPSAPAERTVQSNSPRLPLGRALLPLPGAELVAETPALPPRHPIRSTPTTSVYTQAFEYGFDLSHYLRAADHPTCGRAGRCQAAQSAALSEQVKLRAGETPSR